jgi:hypothetical protein
VLRAVLHDWDDADAVAILRNCRAAMRDDATLLIIERDLGPANEQPGPKFSDLNMLVGLGGQERTIDEYAHLMRQAGLRFIASTPGAFDLHIGRAGPAAPRRSRCDAPVTRTGVGSQEVARFT